MKRPKIPLLTIGLIAAFLGACSAGGGSGGDAEHAFLYVPNQVSNDISAYSVDATSGALTAVSGSPFAAGGGAMSIAAVPTGKFVYIAYSDDGTIGGFSVNASTGALTPVNGSPFPAAPSISSLVVAPSGDHLFTANHYSESLYAYAIDPATGALSRVASCALLHETPADVAVTPSGRFVYAPDHFTAVHGFAFDAASGRLTLVPGSPYTTGGVYPSGGVIDPEGRFFYTTHMYSARIDGFAIDPASGSLSPIAGSPFPMRDIEGSFRLTIDRQGRFVYASNCNHPCISVFSRDTVTGALTEIPGSPFRRAVEPYVYPSAVAIHPSGRFAYASSYFENNVHGFSVDPVSGMLTEIAGSPHPAGDHPVDLAIVRFVR